MKAILLIPALLVCLSATGRTDTSAVNLEIDNDAGQWYLLYPIEAGNTLFSLSRAFQLELDQLLSANQDLDIRSLAIGTVLRIPFAPERLAATCNPAPCRAVSYRVRAGETLYRISKVYFHKDPAAILTDNNLPDETLSIGQELIVGYLDLSAFGAGADATAAVATEVVPEIKEEPQSIGFKERFDSRAARKSMAIQNGVALWFQDAELPDGMYVLHETAPVNSVISITNPMFNRTVYAKVVGNIPAGTYPREVIVIITPKVAQSLGALDPRFYVQIRCEQPQG